MFEQRYQFVLRSLEAGVNMSALCKEFGISREVGYKWKNRFIEEGAEGLRDRSRRPYNSPGATGLELVCHIVRFRTAKPRWGGKKIRACLLRQYEEHEVPSIRSIDRILKNCGFVVTQKHRPKKYESGNGVISPQRCNDVWTVDFKGWWRTGDNRRCEPLTLRDEQSKYLLDIAALERAEFGAVKECFKDCFEQYGLPRYIRSDNGVPFANVQSFCGLTRLAVWWMKLGIIPNRIPVGCPGKNGGHERMHKDIKAELQSLPSATLIDQQKRFDEWLYDYNHCRPHEALGMLTPADCYVPSPRKYDPREPQYQYPSDFEVRKVSRSGEFYWKNKRVSFTKVFSYENLGIKQVDDDQLGIFFGPFQIGTADRTFSRPIKPVTAVGVYGEKNIR